MTLQGHSLIAGEATAGTSGTTHGINPATNEELEPVYTLISADQLRTATEAATDAFDSFRALDPGQHARFLDAIAENIAILDHDIADIDAHSKCHPVVDRNIDVGASDGNLNGNGAIDGLDDAWKLRQHTVTRRSEDFAIGTFYQRIDDASMACEHCQRALFVDVHEA